MTVIRLRNNAYTGLSSDTKPTTVATNSTFLETDTGINWIYNGSSWVVLPIDGLQQAANYTIYISGSNVKARNQVTEVTTSNTDASTTIKSVISALSNGGIINFMPGTYTIQSPLTGWANFRTYQLRGMWDNSRGGGVQLSVGTSFPNNGYVFDTSANSVGSNTRNGLHISDMEIYNINTGTVPNVGAILFESDVPDLSSNFVFRNLYFQYMWRGIHLKGPTFYGVIDNIQYTSASSTSVGNAALIMELAGHGDTPKSNYISHFRGNGPSSAQLDNFILLKDAGYNVFVDTFCDGFKFTEAPVSFKGGAIDNVFYRLYLLDLNTSTGTNVGAILFDGSGGSSNTLACANNRVYDAQVGNYPFMVAYRNSSQRTYVELAHFGGAPTIDDSGAGTNNVVVIKEGQASPSTIDTRITSSNSTVRILDNRPTFYHPSVLPSTGRKTGFFTGATMVNGSGLLSSLQSANINTYNAPTATTGGAVQFATTTTSGTFAGWRSIVNVAIVTTGLNVRFKFKFNKNTNSNQRLWLGMSNSSTVSSPNGDEPLANLHGIYFGFRSTDTDWFVAHNNGAATSTFDDTGISCATDTTNHTVEILSTNGGSNITWQLDSGAPTTIASVLPTNSVAMWVGGGVTNTTIQNCGLNFYYAEVEIDTG